MLVTALSALCGLEVYAQVRPAPRLAITVERSPIYVVPDDTREPLVVLPKGKALNVVGSEDAWVIVRWTEPLFGERTGYVKASNVEVENLDQRKVGAAELRDAPSAPTTRSVTTATGNQKTPTGTSPIAPNASATGAAESGSSLPANAPPGSATTSMASASDVAGAARLDAPSRPAMAAAPVLDRNQAARSNDRDILAAIQRGTRLKGGLTGLRLLDSGQSWANALAAAASGPRIAQGRTGFSLRVYTPLSWIEQLASNASKEYRPFGLTDVTDEMLEPVMRVIVYPDRPTYLNGASFSISSGVQHVVMRDEHRRLVLQPLGTEPFTDVVSSALRDMAYQGLQAKFPMTGVTQLRTSTDDGEFLIVVIGQAQTEKAFKVKKKHFDSLR